jgi:type I restriction enzyme S subunit
MKPDWPTKKLGEIVEFISGNQNINKGKAGPNGKYPAYSASGQDIFLDTYKHEGPAIIVSWIGARCGKCFLADGKWTAIANTQILKIKNENECDYKYLFYFLNDEKKWPRIGGAQPYISKNGAKRIEIPLPPLEIQKRIVARIEELFEKIDKAKQLREKALEETEQIFQSALQEVFETKRKFFQERTLGEVVKIYDNLRKPLNSQIREKMKGKYPYCGANGIVDYINQYIFDGEYLLLAEDGGFWGPNEQSAYIMKGKFWANNHVHVLKPLTAIADIRFLLFTLNYLDLRPYISGSTRGKLNQENLKKIKIFLPPLSEQKKIVAYLDNLREKIEKLKQLQQKQLEELTELKNSILDKAFKGELL